MINRTISAARWAWYAWYERLRLERERSEATRGFVSEDALEGLYWTKTLEWNKPPLISVLIPTHNRVELLMERALPSVLDQSYPNIEIIVAAHGCTDDTVSEAYYQALSYDNINVIEVPRRRTYPPTVENHWLMGPTAPLNAALGAATGAWVARIDDDDEWAPHHLATLLAFAQAQDHEFVSSAYKTNRGALGETVRHDGGDPPIGGVQTWLYRSYLSFMRYNMQSWRKSWNRNNDTDLADRFRRAGVRIGHLDKVTAYVLPRPGETQVGSKAYLEDPVKIERDYAFD